MLVFYKIMAGVGVSILICLLFVLAVSQSLVDSQTVYQDIHNCPDNWMYDTSNNQIRCFVPLQPDNTVNPNKNGGKLSFNSDQLKDKHDNIIPGSSKDSLNGKPYINFHDNEWIKQSIQMPSRLCYIQQWANANEISWMGVSNNYNC